MRNEAERLAVVWGVPIALALLAVGVRLLMSSDRITILGVVRGIVVGVFVGTVVGLYLSDVPDIGEGTRYAITAVSAVLAEDLIVGLMRIGKYIREHPHSIIDWFINRGGKK